MTTEQILLIVAGFIIGFLLAKYLDAVNKKGKKE